MWNYRQEMALAAALLTLAGCMSGPVPSRAAPHPVLPAAAPSPQTYSAAGTVVAIDVDDARIRIAHLPVPALQWPATTMSFRVAQPSLLRNVKPDESVTFSFFQADDGQYVIQDLRPN